MKLLLALFLSGTVISLNAQTRTDSVKQLQQTVKLYDLDFTEAEADSMLGIINNNLLLYKALHKTLPANDITFPFAFDPGRTDRCFNLYAQQMG
jgi:hypothetical protein